LTAAGSMSPARFAPNAASSRLPHGANQTRAAVRRHARATITSISSTPHHRSIPAFFWRSASPALLAADAQWINCRLRSRPLGMHNGVVDTASVAPRQGVSTTRPGRKVRSGACQARMSRADPIAARFWPLQSS
jgi:hypothetical protein